MSYPTMPDAPAPQPVRQPKNGLGTTGFVLGLIGAIFAPIPLIGVVAWPLVILGVIFSALGFVRTRSGAATNTGLSIAGLVLSIIGLVICIVWVVAFSKAASDAVNQTHSVSYDAGGDAKSATVEYSTWSGSTDTDETNSNATLPWHRDVQAKGILSGGQLIVTAGVDGGTVTCKVTVDGQVKKQASATGPLAIADCTNF